MVNIVIIATREKSKYIILPVWQSKVDLIRTYVSRIIRFVGVSIFHLGLLDRIRQHDLYTIRKNIECEGYDKNRVKRNKNKNFGKIKSHLEFPLQSKIYFLSYGNPPTWDCFLYFLVNVWRHSNLNYLLFDYFSCFCQSRKSYCNVQTLHLPLTPSCQNSKRDWLKPG